MIWFGAQAYSTIWKIIFLLDCYRNYRPHCLLGGELVVGNFSNRNTHRSYMEFGGWRLIHRDEDDLLALAKAANIQGAAVRIDQEPNGINLFMHIQKQ